MKETKGKKYFIIIAIILLLILIEQGVKLAIINQKANFYLIENILKITYVENKGGAFGVGQNSTVTFVITNIVVLGIIIRFMITQIERMDKNNLFSLILVLAGGFSNLTDRIFRGFVVDYIDINCIIKYPVFNIADIYIVSGWILLVSFVIITTLKEVKAKRVGVNYEKRNNKNIRSRD